VKRYQPSLEERADEVIQDHMDGSLRKTGEMQRRGRPPRRVPNFNIIYEAVRRKFRKDG
jgi:hypothetical protein